MAAEIVSEYVNISSFICSGCLSEAGHSLGSPERTESSMSGLKSGAGACPAKPP